MMTSFANALLSKYVLIDNIVQDDNNVMHIAFASDANYVKYVGIAIFSILLNNKNKNLCFHIFADSIYQDDLKKLAMLDNFRAKIMLYYLDNTVFDVFSKSNSNNTNHISLATYYRFAIMDMIDDLVEKFLYLDADIICHGDIEPLFSIGIDNYMSLVVMDIFSPTLMEHNKYLSAYGFDANFAYFNAGVMLINNKKWKNEKTTKKVVDLMLAFKNNPPEFMDQDFLNIVLQHNVLFISEKYNWQRWLQWQGSLLERQIDNLVFVHFLGKQKPWSIYGKNAIYDNYKMKSPWWNIVYDPPSNEKDYKWYRRYASYLKSINQHKESKYYHRMYLTKKCKYMALKLLCQK